MPRLIDCPTDEAIDLGTLIAALDEGEVDPRDEDGFARWGEMLKRLANNRHFLADLMIDELKSRCRAQMRGNQYSAQVIMLHLAQGRYFIRANMWPAAGDSIVRQSGTDPFFYHIPHDHNFSFLTAGYLGPGYWSDYYEYDHAAVAGYAGEPVDLRFVERARLEAGKVMLYRAHRDVHLQLPADSLSVSLNIVESSNATMFRDQYRFDVEAGTVGGILTRAALEPLLMLAAHHGGGNGLDLIDQFAARHPSDRIRWAALQAQAAAAGDLDGRLAILEGGARDRSRLVAEQARAAAERLAAGRAWIEARPELDPA